jgi:hypothetical protein
MARTTRYSQEVRERTVRMVFEHRGEYASVWEALDDATRVRALKIYRRHTQANAIDQQSLVALKLLLATVVFGPVTHAIHRG